MLHSLKDILNKYFFFKAKSYEVHVLRILLLSSFLFYLIIWLISRTGFIYLPKLGYDIDCTLLYNPAIDGSYFEFFQYLLLLWCSILSFLVIRKRALNGAGFIPVIYLFLFFDDFLRIHDSLIGDFLEEKYDNNIQEISFIRSKDLAEVSYWIIILIIILIVFFIFYKNINQESKKFIQVNFVFFVVLSFFGIFIDVVGANKPIILNTFLINGAFTFVEEFGEIFTISSAFLWMFHFLTNDEPLT